MRTTCMNFRDPRQATPDPYLYPFMESGVCSNDHIMLGKGKKGSMAKDDRFGYNSIYHLMMKKTTDEVGPGCYNDD